MPDPQPLVSLGMPTFNGAHFLRLSLGSLMDQTYPNFELFICDNASSDETEDICREFASMDSRIRYSRNDTNVGALVNFRRTLEEARGKYFMWVADHDVWSPEAVSEYVAALETDPDSVLVYGLTTLIDENGEEMGCAPDRLDTTGIGLVARYERVIWNLHWCNMVYGLFRTDVLKRATIAWNSWAWDNVLLAELSLEGGYRQLARALWYRREYRNQPSAEERRRRVLISLYGDEANLDTSQSELYRSMRDAHLEVLRRRALRRSQRLRMTLSTYIAFRARFGVPLGSFEQAYRVCSTVIPSAFQSRMRAMLAGSWTTRD